MRDECRDRKKPWKGLYEAGAGIGYRMLRSGMGHRMPRSGIGHRIARAGLRVRLLLVAVVLFLNASSPCAMAVGVMNTVTVANTSALVNAAALANMVAMMDITALANSDAAASPAMGDGTDPLDNPEAAIIAAEVREAEILTALRGLQLDIARKAAEADQRRLEREDVARALRRIEADLQLEGQRYANSKTTLANVLAAWQTAGAASRLELLLDSDSLALFLHRLSALRQLDRDTSALLNRLDNSLQTMETQRLKQQETIAELDRQSAEIQRVLQLMRQQESDLEASLAALQADRGRYEAMLSELEKTWEKALDVFPQLTAAFTTVIAEGGFPEDALEISFGLTGVNAVMREERFDAILGEAKNLPPLTFEFKSADVHLVVPEAALDLHGLFDVKDGVTLVFHPLSGTQGGLPLTAVQLADLSRKGALEFRLEPVMMGATIREVNPEPGLLNLSISMSFLW